MKPIEIFDPAMCCSTGVCGPAVDPELARFAGELAVIEQQGASVRRYNLAQEPLAFAQNPVVAKALQDGGPECLPLVLVGGEIRAMGTYPTGDKLLHWAGIAALPPEGGQTGQTEPTPAKTGGCGCGPKGCA